MVNEQKKIGSVSKSVRQESRMRQLMSNAPRIGEEFGLATPKSKLFGDLDSREWAVSKLK